MTTTTTNYDLILYNGTSDLSGSTINYLLNVSGSTGAGGSGSSNMQKIDEALYDLYVSGSILSGSVVSLENEIETGWIPDTDTWVYVSATSFKVEGKDVTSKFPIGTKIKLTQTTVKYFYVVSTAFSTDTTITVTGGSDYTVANATITSPNYSYSVTPQDFPDWFNWTPSYGASGSMTFSSVTTDYALFRIIGKLLDLKINFFGTTGGTASVSLTVTLPITRTSNSVQVLPTSVIISGASVYSVGQTFTVNTTTLNVRKSDTSNWALGANTRATLAGSIGITF